MKKKKAVELVTALRSGEYKQGKGHLADCNDQFCCLGVACRISETGLEWALMGNIWYIGGMYYMLPKEVQEEFGFYSPTGLRRDNLDLKIGNEVHRSLAEANDAGVSFADIANYIEENWEAL